MRLKQEPQSSLWRGLFFSNKSGNKGRILSAVTGVNAGFAFMLPGATPGPLPGLFWVYLTYWGLLLSYRDKKVPVISAEEII